MHGRRKGKTVRRDEAMPIRSCNSCDGGKKIAGIGRLAPEWLGSRTDEHVPLPLLAPLLSSPAMRAVCDDAAHLQHMLDFEAALARAEAAVGVIPASRGGGRSRPPARPTSSISQPWPRPPRVPAISPSRWSRRSPPKSAKADAEAARYVHWGATSQDVIDTATMLDAARRASTRCSPDLDRAIAGFAGLARSAPRHRRWWPAPGCSTRCRCRSG